MNGTDLSHLDEDALDLVEMLRSECLDDRLVGAVGLQHLGDEDTIPFLIEALDDPSDAVQCIAVTSLWEMAHQSSVTPLTRCLKSDRSEKVRSEALAALKELVEAQFPNQNFGHMTLDFPQFDEKKHKEC